MDNDCFCLTKKQNEKIEDWKIKHWKQEHPVMFKSRKMRESSYIYSFRFDAGVTTLKCTCIYCHMRAQKNAVMFNKFNRNLYREYMIKHDGEIEFDDEYFKE